MIQFFIYVLLAIAVYFYIKETQAKKAGKKVSQGLKNLEQKYNDYVSKSINSFILKQDHLDIDHDLLLQQSLQVLKPDIDALIFHINASKNKYIQLTYESVYFRNAAAILENLTADNQRPAAKNLSDVEKESIYNAFADAIKSDLLSRTLTLKTGQV